MQDLRGSVVAHLIEAQRLLRLSAAYPSGYPARPRNVYRVLDCASDLGARINDTMARYGQQSQRLDQSFPQRLLALELTTLSADDLKLRMEGLDTKRAEMKDIGLLNEPEEHPFDTGALDSLDSAQQRVMSFYVQNTSKKLEVLTDLARRTRLLLDNVNPSSCTSGSGSIARPVWSPSARMEPPSNWRPCLPVSNTSWSCTMTSCFGSGPIRWC